MNSVESGASWPREGSRSHICTLFRRDSERLPAVVPFLLEGIRRNDRCMYFSDRLDKEDLFDSLMAAVPMNEEELEARVTFRRVEDVYLKDGRFDRDRMLGFLVRSQEEAFKEGRAGLTAAGETSWAARCVSGDSELIDYEARVNLLYPDMSADLLCEYSESDFDAATLANAIRAHPKVLVRGVVCGNPYYLSPETLMAFASGSVTMDVVGLMEKDMFSRSVLSEIGDLEARELKRSRMCLSVLDEMVLGDFKDRLAAVSFFNELALDACEDGETARHIRSADSKCRELLERLETLRMFRACMESPMDWQSLDEVISKAVDRALGDSRKASVDIGSFRIFASASADKAFSAFVSSVADRSPASTDIDIRARKSTFGLTVTIGAEGSGVPEGAKESLFDPGEPCVCGRSLCLARELLESSGFMVREVGVPGRSTVFEVHAPASRYREK